MILEGDKLTTPGSAPELYTPGKYHYTQVYTSVHGHASVIQYALQVTQVYSTIYYTGSINIHRYQTCNSD